MNKQLFNVTLLTLCFLAFGWNGSFGFSQGKADPKDGIKLFNGKNLDGWHTFNKEGADACWRVEDNAIVLDHDFDGGGDLVSDGTYKNFILELDWKISDAGNSGILFNVQEGPKFKETYMAGLEMQVLDNKNASDNKKENHLAGSLYDLIPCNPKYVNPAGEWNTIKIKQKDGKITFWMNDHKALSVQMGSDSWNQLVENSKFGKGFFKGVFGNYQQGHIALQDHGHKVWYRNISLKEL